MRAFLIALVLLAGCATTTTTQRVEVPVPVPCLVPDIKKPAFPADELTEQDDIFKSIKAWIATDLLHRAYEQELEAALSGCRTTPSL
jgi:hypothetical protein